MVRGQIAWDRGRREGGQVKYYPFPPHESQLATAWRQMMVQGGAGDERGNQYTPGDHVSMVGLSQRAPGRSIVARMWRFVQHLTVRCEGLVERGFSYCSLDQPLSARAHLCWARMLVCNCAII